jgi:hypothetical protein
MRLQWRPPGHPRLDGECIVEDEDHFLIVTKEDVG